MDIYVRIYIIVNKEKENGKKLHFVCLFRFCSNDVESYIE